MEFYKSIISLIIFTIYNLPLSESYKFLAGGKDGWVIHPSDAYDHWAGRNRFLVNDTIFFKYKKGEDSVLLVNKEDYGTCNTKNPIKKWDDGGTIFKFDRSGPFYFISGKKGHCQSGQKLAIVVLAVRYPPSPPTPPKSGPAPVASPPGGGSSSPPTASPPSGGSSSPPTASPPATPAAPSPGGSKPPVSSPPPAASPMPAAMTPSSTSPTGVPGPTAISPSSSPSSGPAAASPTPALTPSITPASSSPPLPSSTSPTGAPGGGGGPTSGASPPNLPANSTSPPAPNGSSCVIPPPRLWALVVVLVSILVLG